jgi:hypothetical protein
MTKSTADRLIWSAASWLVLIAVAVMFSFALLNGLQP